MTRVFALILVLLPFSGGAVPQYLGDLNEDNKVDVRDLVILVNHLNALQGQTNSVARLLSFPLSFFTDVNQDGVQNPSDVDALRDIILGKHPVVSFPLDTIIETSPAHGESSVSVTRETIFRFSQPLAATTVLDTNHLFATFGGQRLLTWIDLSSDRKTVTLFYRAPLPASARVRVTFNSAGLLDFVGRALDLDGDGVVGGIKLVDFDTLSITPVAGTVVIGHVFASQQVPVANHNNTTNFVDHPLPGVLISVVGAEQEIFTRTDTQGFFQLSNCPAGRFFVSIDGTKSPESTWPGGAYYPVVGKPWETIAGRTNIAGIGPETNRGSIYLPLVQAGTLRDVNPMANTTIGFPTNIIVANPAWAGVSVTIPTNALYKDDGTRGGRVGLAPVPADRLPERLPPGIVHALDISIQTDGPQNVDRPLPVRFPNMPDPQTGLKLPSGGKSALMSYNHDTGRWEVQGPMTVTADGNYVETDPGVGVRQPGWHGSMQGSQGNGGPMTGTSPGNGPPGSGPGTGSGGNGPGNGPGSGPGNGPGNAPGNGPAPSGPGTGSSPSGLFIQITTYPSSRICPNEIVGFTAQGSPAGGGFLWSGGDPVSATDQSFYEAQFRDPGTYTVALTYSNPTNASDTASASVQVAVNENSGPIWVQKFPDHKDPNELNAQFGPMARAFLAALGASVDSAGKPADVGIGSVLRPYERSYLMRHSFLITWGAETPDSVPPFASPTTASSSSDVDICWLWHDNDGSENPPFSYVAAQEMVSAYHIASTTLGNAPAFPSRHNVGAAIDLTISWSGTLTIDDKGGNTVTIDTGPRDQTNSKLVAVALTYGLHWRGPGDNVHFSDNGK